MHPEGIRGPLTDRGGTGSHEKKKRKKKWLRRHRKSNKEDVLLFLLGFRFVLFFSTRPLLQRPPSMQDSGDPREHRGVGAERARTDADSLQSTTTIFRTLRKRHRRGSRAETPLTQLPERKLRSPPTASDLSLCIFLSSHRTPLATLVFFGPPPPPPVWRPAIRLICPTLRRGKKRGRRLPASSAARRGPGSKGNVRGSGEEARGMDGPARGGGASITSPPVEQKPLYFLP